MPSHRPVIATLLQVGNPRRRPFFGRANVRKKNKLGPASRMAEPIAASQHLFSSAACQSLRSVGVPSCRLLIPDSIPKNMCFPQPKVTCISDDVAVEEYLLSH